MAIRYKEWAFLLPVVGLGILLANFVGFKVAFGETLPGVLILLGITLAAVFVSRTVPLKLPIVAYCSLFGILLACPISPVSGFVIEAVSKINFTSPLTIVGALAGIGVGKEIKTFAKQGWKMLLIALLVMTCTFVGSAIIAQLALGITGII